VALEQVNFGITETGITGVGTRGAGTSEFRYNYETGINGVHSYKKTSWQFWYSAIIFLSLQISFGIHP
jgi:hypothetical protein